MAKRKTRAYTRKVPLKESVIHETLLVPGYGTLQEELIGAYTQASAGKGKERHANNKPFDRQPIMEVSRIVGHGFQTGQAMKKLGEASQMADRGEFDKAIHEIQGAMVYCAAAIMRIRESAAAK